MRAGDTRSGVNNFFVNTNVTELQGSDWERLLKRCVCVPLLVKGGPHMSHSHHRVRIGESAMFHLLTEASIFMPLPNECLCQLTGVSLVFLPSPTLDLDRSALTALVSSEKRKRGASPHPEAPALKKRFQHTSRNSE